MAETIEHADGDVTVGSDPRAERIDAVLQAASLQPCRIASDPFCKCVRCDLRSLEHEMSGNALHRQTLSREVAALLARVERADSEREDVITKVDALLSEHRHRNFYMFTSTDADVLANPGKTLGELGKIRLRDFLFAPHSTGEVGA